MEPAADLGMALALASSLRNTPLADGMAAVGEIGLGGEIRSISQLPRRLMELSHMGFDSCLGLESAIQALEATPGMKTTGAETIVQGLALAFPSSSMRGTSNKVSAG